MLVLPYLTFLVNNLEDNQIFSAYDSGLSLLFYFFVYHVICIILSHQLFFCVVCYILYYFYKIVTIRIVDIPSQLIWGPRAIPKNIET